jgi:hypothetical protein
MTRVLVIDAVSELPVPPAHVRVTAYRWRTRTDRVWMCGT